MRGLQMNVDNIYDPILWFTIGSLIAVLYTIIEGWLQPFKRSVVNWLLTWRWWRKQRNDTTELSGRS